MLPAARSGLVATPEVSGQLLSPADELLIMGCDGLFDVMNAEEVWDVARSKGKARGQWDLAKCAEALVQAALDRESGDNVSVVVVLLKPPRTAAGRPAAAAKPKPANVGVNVTLAANGTIQKVALAPAP